MLYETIQAILSARRQRPRATLPPPARPDALRDLATTLGLDYHDEALLRDQGFGRRRPRVLYRDPETGALRPLMTEADETI